jgi:hypothetical protein
MDKQRNVAGHFLGCITPQHFSCRWLSFPKLWPVYWHGRLVIFVARKEIYQYLMAQSNSPGGIKISMESPSGKGSRPYFVPRQYLPRIREEVLEEE